MGKVTILGRDYDMPPQVTASGGEERLQTPHEFLMIGAGEEVYCIWGRECDDGRHWVVDRETCYQEWVEVGIGASLYDALELVYRDMAQT